MAMAVMITSPAISASPEQQNAAIVLVAIALIVWRYHDYIVNPWTRDGQVMANVIQVAPRVSGPVVDLPIIDNQRVKAGDLLFRIDPRTYQTDLALAEAKVDYTKKNLLALDKQVAAALRRRSAV